MSYHYKRDGSLDMRYSSSRAAVSSGSGSYSSSGTSYSSGYGGGSSSSSLHYKRDGTLDMRYSSSKQATTSARTYAPSFNSINEGPTSNLNYKRDGTLDMRYASSKQTLIKPTSNTATSNDLHYKRDDTLDMRYNSSKAPSPSQGQQGLIQKLGNIKLGTQNNKHIPSNIPLTKVGLPDMRTKVAKEWIRKQAMDQGYGALPEWMPKLKDGSLDTNKSATVEYLKHSPWNAFAIENSYVEDCRQIYYERKLENEEFRSCVQEVRDKTIRVNAPQEEECCLQNSQIIKQQLSSSSDLVDLPLETDVKHIDNFDEVTKSELTEIGRGAFGTVYKGKWNNKIVAVKKLHLNALSAKEKRSFQKEVMILSFLGEHQNLVKLFAFSTQPPALVMEYVSRGSLSHLLYYIEDPMVEANISDGRIKKQIINGVVSGMIQLHKVEVIHGDLKPQNILITENYEAKITDFGLASLRGKSIGTVCSSNFTDENIIGGTGAYMAPELLSFTADRNYSCDVYSFGMLLNEMIREEEPYQDQFKNFALRGPTAATLYASAGNRPKLSPELSNDLKNLITSCWDSQPKRRPTFSTILNSLSNMTFPNSCNLGK